MTLKTRMTSRTTYACASSPYDASSYPSSSSCGDGGTYLLLLLLRLLLLLLLLLEHGRGDRGDLDDVHDVRDGVLGGVRDGGRGVRAEGEGTECGEEVKALIVVVGDAGARDSLEGTEVM